MQSVESELPIAVRVYPDSKNDASTRSQSFESRPDAMLVFDCETRTDKAQALTFGCYRFIVAGKCLEEGLFFADDLPEVDREILEHHVRANRADVDRDGSPNLKLLTLEQFLAKLYDATYRGRCLLVAFNFPFDISRLAYDSGAARGHFYGGFSFRLFNYRDKHGETKPNKYRIRIAVKHIDSKRALKGFTGSADPDKIDQIPEGSKTGRPIKGHVFRGHILDLRTLAFALTDCGYTLESACAAFAVKHGKVKIKQHGIVTDEYIAYNRRDVLATAELAEKLLAEYDRHPIALQATKAYSPASIGKAYLRGMGVRPIMQRQSDFPKRIVGYAQTGFFGGRASAHIRKVPVPVVYCDFLSEYSTVNVLMGLWKFVVAKEIRVVENCVYEVEQFLREVTPDWCFDPANWSRLTGFARIVPDGDVLPLRAKYGGNDWQIGLNHAYGAPDGLWYALPDLVASVLLTGKQPRIIEASRIEAVGQLDGLKPIRFRGDVKIDPGKDDFFKKVIEERQTLAKRTDMTADEKKKLNQSLKTLASATSYGIFAQMDRQERDGKVNLDCYGIDPKLYSCKVEHPETPGEFCFPPLAALITSAGHLLLALLERLVTDLGGTYAMEDTDSMAIVATRRGGLVACPGGPHRMRDGTEAIRALSRAQVRVIVAKFERLNPYDRSSVPGSILKIEKDNFNPKTGRQRQLWCYAISAKRYILFLKRPDGTPELLRKNVNNDDDRWSEHGLGHLLNPTDPDDDDREWIAEVWLGIVRMALGLRAKPKRFTNLPAVGRVSASNSFIMRSLKSLNHGKPYEQQIKPFNFMLSSQVREFGHPSGADPERFHLIAPYESKPSRWLALPWINQYTGRKYRVTTSRDRGRDVAALKTYGDVIRAYEDHPEVKCAAPNGEPCGKLTFGMLGRRQVRITRLHFIGKESNRLEEIEGQTVTDSRDVYAEYADQTRDDWATSVLPKLRMIRMSQLQQLSGLSRSTLQAVRAGRRPHPRNVQLLITIVNQDQKVSPLDSTSRKGKSEAR